MKFKDYVMLIQSTDRIVNRSYYWVYGVHLNNLGWKRYSKLIMQILRYIKIDLAYVYNLRKILSYLLNISLWARILYGLFLWICWYVFVLHFYGYYLLWSLWMPYYTWWFVVFKRRPDVIANHRQECAINLVCDWLS